DFFSGSGTTAQAVMQLNAEDGGNRKYIMVQLPELTEEKSAAFKAGYENLCQLGEERIKRAVRKIHSELPNSSFDDGFKVFEVSNTNIKWNTVDDEEIQKLDETDYGNDKERIDFTKGYTDIDVVYEIMLRQFDIPLSTPIEKLSSVSDRTYIFADAVVVCLEPEITTELIEKLAAIEPTPAKFVLRDSAFNDDIQLKDVSFRRLSALIKNHQTEEERKSKYNNYTVEFI
ncbi:MAG: site-specific DNA-methyltransferase, partial [Clostridia bacterium]|nr:site-specific DNA-methyltransferase [Clostridia bacterium]